MTTLQTLFDEFRERADDRAATPLWSDARLQTLANEAQVEACRRARLIEDRSTPEICQVALTSGTSIYDLDKRIIRLRRIKLAGRRMEVLPKIDERDLERHTPDWESYTPGEPMVWVPWGSWQFRTFRTPDAADTAHLWVIREPLLRMRTAKAAASVTLTRSGTTATATIAADTSLVTGDTVTIAGAAQAEYNGNHVITVISSTTFTFTVDVGAVTPATGTITYAVAAVDAEIAPRQALKLPHWMLYQALLDRDKEEKYDAAGAERHLGEFESEFGKRSSAIDETWIARHHEVDDLEGIY